MPMQKYFEILSKFRGFFFPHAKLIFTNLKGNEFMGAIPVESYFYMVISFYLWMDAQ